VTWKKKRFRGLMTTDPIAKEKYKAVLSDDKERNHKDIARQNNKIKSATKGLSTLCELL